MKFLFLFLTVLAFAAVDWNSLLNQKGGQNVRFGVSLAGPEPFVRHGEEYFAPASTAKVFTAAAALAILGPNYRYVTRLEWRADSEGVAEGLRLIGSGDPSWGMLEFGDGLRTKVTAIAKALRASGVRTIRGDVEALSNDPRWENIEIPTGWKPADPLGCGGTLAQGFNLDINCSTLKITSATTYTWASGAGTPVNMQVTAGSTTNITASLTRLEDGRLGYVVKGSLKKGGSRSFSLPVWSTNLWIKNLFTAALQEQGIRFVSSPAQMGSALNSYEMAIESPPLSELIKPFLKNSINFLGDAFLKTLAVEQNRNEESLLEGGLAVIHDYFLRLGVPNEFMLHDGSGLSRTALVTPRAMKEMLELILREPYFPSLWNALAIAGLDGTLKNRMKGTAAEARLRGKTGTLDGVYNLAGYVPAKNSFEPFVILTKTTTAQSATARAAADRVGAKLASITPSPKRPLPPPEPFPIFVPEHAGFDQR